MDRKRNSLTFFLLLIMQSCGIAILDIELPEGAPILVVEGTISNLEQPHRVLLSQSTSFNNPSPYYIDNAVVIISSQHGASDTLKYVSKGAYETQIKGIPGNTYQLDILHEGKHYQAVSTMPAPASVDSVSIRFFPESLVREEGYYALLHALDPEEQEGYYRWMIWKNDTLHIENGRAGYFSTLELNKDNEWLNLQYPAPFKVGDSLKIHTIKMDKDVYTYYQGLYELMVNDGGLMGPVPVNPQTNISGNALGVFQAISIVEKEIVVR